MWRRVTHGHLHISPAKEEAKGKKKENFVIGALYRQYHASYCVTLSMILSSRNFISPIKHFGSKIEATYISLQRQDSTLN
jgi:hypothetical protein